uniref:NAD-dependent epimerase/dehydratase domain-containing protein n=1 Tax=Leersia perrieri TaxID=77586 RepID=A0A0D9V100_9ORYZ
MRGAAAAALSTLLPAPTPTSTTALYCPSSARPPVAASRPPRLLLLPRRAPHTAAALGVSDDTGVNVSSTDIVGQNDLLIVGPGVLGRLVAEKWKEEHPGCKVFGQTASTDHHSELSNIGIIPSLKGSTFPQKVPYDCPSVPIGRSPRTDVLLKAENVVLEAGGCVKGSLDSRPDHIINQIHYEDAASLAIAIMKKRHRSHIFLGCDNKPLSRQEIMDSVNRSGKFDTKFQGFTGTDGPLGKRMENSKTRSEIGWEPKYPSFSEFLGLDS